MNVQNDAPYAAGGIRGAGTCPRAGGGHRRHRHRRHGPRAAGGDRGGAQHRGRRPDRSCRHRRRRGVRAHRTPAGRVRRHLYAARLPDGCTPRRGARRGGNRDPRYSPVGAARRAGGRGRQPRAAALGDGIPGSHRCDSFPRRHEPGSDHARLPVAESRAVVQRRHAPDQRRGVARASGQPAQPRPRPHAGAGQRQAPPPLGDSRLVRRRHGRHAGTGHLDHPGDRAAAGGGAARRRVGAVRLRRHRRRAELPPRGRPRRRQPGVQHRGLPRGRRGRLQRRRQRRTAARRQRLRQPQPGVRQRRPDRPQRAARRRGGAHRGRQHGGGRPGAALGQHDQRGRPEAVRQLRSPQRQRPAVLRSRQLRAQDVDAELLFSEPQYAGQHLQPRRRPDAPGRGRARRARRRPGRLGRLSLREHHRQQAGSDGPGAGVRRPELLLVPGGSPGWVHPVLQRRDHGPVGGDRTAPRRGQWPDLGRQRELRCPPGGLLPVQHRQRVARSRHAAQFRSGSLPAGGGQPQPRRFLRRHRQGPPGRRRRVAGRALHHRRRGAAVLGGRSVRGAGLRLGLQRLPGVSRLHGRDLDARQRRPLRRRGTGRSRRPLDRRRRPARRALRRVRRDGERQAVGPLRAGRRRLGARRRQHRVPRPHPRPAEHVQRAVDHQPQDAGSGRQRHRAVHLPGRAAPGRPAARSRDVDQRDGRAGGRHRRVHAHRRLLPGGRREPPRPVAELHARGGRACVAPVGGHHVGAHPGLLPVLHQRFLDAHAGHRRGVDLGAPRVAR